MSHFSSLALVFVICFLIGGTESQKMSKNGNSLKFAKFSGPTLNFLFWKVYDQFAYAIQQKYPELIIQGENYPPLPLYALISQILGVMKIIFIILIASGQNPFNWFNINTPSFYNWALENKIYACMILFFICNAIENTLISTGAFEISFNDVPIWSKLETGRIPSPHEMFQILDNHLKMAPKDN